MNCNTNENHLNTHYLALQFVIINKLFLTDFKFSNCLFSFVKAQCRTKFDKNLQKN